MLRRSLTRINKFNRNHSKKRGPVTTDVIIGDYEYLMTYSIGTPPVPSLGVLDTGSDVTWTQCKPCTKCFKQKVPLFKPRNSSTYNKVRCGSNLCNTFRGSNCNLRKKKCGFQVLYGDGSFASGNVARDTLTLGNVSFTNYVFGCAHNDGGIFYSGESGIVGLGVGQASLISQLGSSIHGKFSYCLVPFSANSTKSGKLNFGNNAVVSGEGVATTPFALNPPQENYYLTMEAISVDNQRFEFDDDPLNKAEGNIIIDSGTTLTFIPTNLYDKVETAVEKTIKLKRVKDPLRTFNLCYYTKTDIRFPVITVHFKGADVKLNPENAFFKTDDSTRCLAFQPRDGPIFIYGSLEYLITYSIGTPPVHSLGVLDTSSDITWTQCKPCAECFKQKVPLFEPKKSSTYYPAPCSSDSCKTFRGSNCDGINKICRFKVLYGDGSFAGGDIATDVRTLGSITTGNVSFSNYVFGCGINNGGVFASGESGVVGLGIGKGSLISQLGSSIEGKFSYYLVPISANSTKSGKLNFGNNAVVSGEGVVTTPFALKPPQAYYYLTMEAISVNNQRFEFYDDPLNKTEGNIILDSGTTLTFIPTNLYDKVEKAVERIIKLKRVKDPLGYLSLCYSTKTDIRFPVITVHFKGADVRLNPENAFFKMGDSTGCLSFRAQDDPIFIYGNVAQMNFLVGYVVERKIVSFKHTDCNKY
ncbi:hypothetical protein RD792_004443 [Penstemon davidsonii]|uniref:Peptidase A1 domain-containing protein n=1 Tax=Penstemon davidsonii TaxID=160366 RepID=A0ABR0DHK8_9LAMI|nr:hypothetical protein RD792_004443 [Penstemon davidsonii]